MNRAGALPAQTDWGRRCCWHPPALLHPGIIIPFNPSNSCLAPPPTRPLHGSSRDVPYGFSIGGLYCSSIVPLLLLKCSPCAPFGSSLALRRLPPGPCLISDSSGLAAIQIKSHFSISLFPLLSPDHWLLMTDYSPSAAFCLLTSSPLFRHT